MEASARRSLLLGVCYSTLFFNLPSFHSFSPFSTGIHPLDEEYYAAELIKCKDGSNTFTRDRLNDDFCDCPDGTDEPGTSACPLGKFYCRNVGSTPKFVFSSRVNDHICDCCDGSDENDGTVDCPNTCVMGGNFAYHTTTSFSRVSRVGSLGAKRSKLAPPTTDGTVQKLIGLKMLAVLQVVFVLVVVAFRLSRRRVRSRRRHVL